jgi:broad specificity phosphatase PhoE
MEAILSAFDSDYIAAKNLWVDLHEFGGLFVDEIIIPGMNSEQIKAISVDIKFEDLDLDSGWWKTGLRESDEAFKDRIKRIVSRLKEMAAQFDDEYTIALITHGFVLNAVFTILNNCELLYNSIIY